MNIFFESFIHNPFLITALLGGCLASIASGIMGSYVTIKRISFISGSISHSILGGVGFFLWLARTKGVLWVSPLGGALFAGILSAILIGYIHLRFKQREDTVIAAVWSVGMALGILFLSQTPGFNVELTNFLIGNILWVTEQDLMTLCALDAVVIVAVCLLHQRLLQLCFDEDQARLQGIAVQKLWLFLLVLVSISVVILMQVVGVVLVMTMLTLPSAIANMFTVRLSRMMLLATVLSIIFCVIGTFAANLLDWPIGATIALTAGLAYVSTLIGAGTNGKRGI